MIGVRLAWDSFVVPSPSAPVRSPRKATRACCVAAVVASVGFGSAALAVQGTWTVTGGLNTPRYGHVSVALPNGKVLAAGGNASSDFLATAELYDPATGNWSYTGSLNGVRNAPSATLLPDGKVLVVGGEGYHALASAEIYDPATQTWTVTGAMANGRVVHTATRLQSGKVLVAGGYQNGVGLAGAEVFDPATGTWVATGALTVPRYQHSATLLPNGKVLVVGGEQTSDTAEIYDPATGIWASTSPPLAGRNVSTAALLPNGKVLLAGGGGSIASAELYEPSSAAWSLTGSLAQGRYVHTETTLPGGKVLLAGGFNSLTGLPVNTSELYDPATGQWTGAGNVTGRYYHAAALLQSGAVVVSGGFNGSAPLGIVEIYTPAVAPYQFAGFFQPVDNLPALNSANAGSAIPVKFSLGGDRGLAVLAAGFPKSQETGCSGNAVAFIEETVTAGGSALTYHAASDQYSYVWKTEKAWRGTCRQLILMFNDGSIHRANFAFTR